MFIYHGNVICSLFFLVFLAIKQLRNAANILTISWHHRGKKIGCKRRQLGKRSIQDRDCIGGPAIFRPKR